MIKVAAFDSSHGEITILRSRSSGAVLYREGACNQSEADARGVSLATYIHAIFGLILQAECSDVLMIGCGGGTLASMLCVAGKRVVIVDTNALAFKIARDYFGLPKEVECHVADGQAFLVSQHRSYDAIVLDAYCVGEIPDHLQTQEFFRLVSIRLTKPGGCFFANVCASNEDGASDRFAASMSPMLKNIRILDGEFTDEGNSIVAAGAVTALTTPTLRIAPEVQFGSIAEGLRRLRFRHRRRVQKEVRQKEVRQKEVRQKEVRRGSKQTTNR